MTSPKKKFSRNRYRSASPRKRLQIGLVIIGSCIVVWGSLLLLSQSGPGKIKTQPAKASRPLAKAVNPVADNAQKPSAEALMTTSVALEDEARVRMNSGDYETASSNYDKAARLQQRINQDYLLSQYVDASRVIRLQMEAKNAVAEPLFAESLHYERQADSFFEAGDLDSAKEALTHAIDMQQQLNETHRDARQSSVSRLQQLKSRLAELKAKELSLEISTLSERANSLAALEESEAAAKLLQEATLLQEQLNTDFPESSYASPVRVHEFRKREQVARSASLAQELEEQSVRLMQLLAERSVTEATQLLTQLNEKLRVFEEKFPLSTLIDETLKTKLAFLYRKQTQLSDIQHQVYGALIVVPNTEGVRMLSTEVSQSLYTQLMDSNPSRNLSGSNPVDSVSWTEATVFCDRMSWILGKTVRLPVEEEFRKALSGFDPAESSDSIWSASTAKGSSQPTGRKKPFSNGFFDLLGNVSEWLTSENLSESNTAYHIGGNAQDSLETILTIPIRSLKKTERNRMTGFRIVVQNR